MYNALPVSTKVQVAALLQTEEESITLEWANVHKQPNGRDCGIFAIAFATALCHSQMAEEKFFMSYNWDSTFMSASPTNTFSQFQLEECARRRQRKRKPFTFIATAGLQPRYIEMMCDGCHEWYDEQCEVIPAAAWAILIWSGTVVNLLSKYIFNVFFKHVMTLIASFPFGMGNQIDILHGVQVKLAHIAWSIN